MGDSNKFLSIDEQAISNKSVNLEEATYNLKELQKHIFYLKSTTDFPRSSTACIKSSGDFAESSVNDSTNSARYTKSPAAYEHTASESIQSRKSSDQLDSLVTGLKPSADTSVYCINNSKFTAAMDGGKQIKLSSGQEIFYVRQPSVTDEDLFGDGKNQQNENHAHPNNGNLINERIEENTEQPDYNAGVENKEDSDKSGNFENKDDVCGIPNFEMLGFSSGSVSDSSSSPKPFKVIEENKIQSGQEIIKEKQSFMEFSDGQDSDFKLRYRDGRSFSAVDRRQKYRNSSGGEVFDHTIESVEDEYSVGKHDIVRKSNSLPDLVTSSSLSPLSPPRYHSNPSPIPDVAENLEEQYEYKKKLEGSSSMPSSKHKIKRTVSIKEEPEYIPADNPDESEDERSPKIKSEETEERRRILSSGYVTGSSEAGSQDKSEMGTSRQTSQLSQGSSDVWTSQESEMVEQLETVAETKVETVVNKSLSAEVQELDKHLLSTNSNGSNERQSVSPVSFGSSCNESNSTESSINTILDAKTHEVVRKKITNSPNGTDQVSHGGADDKSDSVGLPYLSIMDTSNVSRSSSETFSRLRSKDESMENKGARNKVSQFVESKPPDSYEPQSNGNLPNFSTLESFSLKRSSLDKVHEEEDKNRQAVTKKYCEGLDGSLGVLGPSSVQPLSRGSSSSTHGSTPEAVKRLEEIILKTGDAISPSILDKIGQVLHGPDSLSPHTNHDKEKIEGSGSQSFKELTLDDVERASRCNFPACNEICCLKMCEVFRVLKLDIPDLDPSYKLVRNYYSSLYQHYDNVCDETKCPVLFCNEFREWETESAEDPVKYMVREIQKYLRNPTMKLFFQTSYKFHKLQSHIPKQEINEFETHIPMFPLGKFGAAHVCMENQSQRLVVLKMYPLMECDQQLQLYTALKDLNHPNIVPQLWMLGYEDKIQVCSLFAQGGSLESYLCYVGGLPWSRVVLYMKQILSAVTHLNSLGVVYLNWNSGNMLFPDDRRHTVQVGNFSLSCPVNFQCDIGAVKQCLPYNICPPELFHWNYKANFKSDVWGAGCLFYEMLAGTPFLHELRHEDRKTVHGKITEGYLPDTKSWSREKRNILDSCWQKKLDDRRSLQDVLKYIQSLRVT